jgi:hypothetical protein
MLEHPTAEYLDTSSIKYNSGSLHEKLLHKFWAGLCALIEINAIYLALSHTAISWALMHHNYHSQQCRNYFQSMYCNNFLFLCVGNSPNCLPSPGVPFPILNTLSYHMKTGSAAVDLDSCQNNITYGTVFRSFTMTSLSIKKHYFVQRCYWFICEYTDAVGMR